MKIPQIRCSDVNAVKRIIFLLVLLIPFCLAGCSSDDDEGDNGGERRCSGFLCTWFG